MRQSFIMYNNSSSNLNENEMPWYIYNQGFGSIGIVLGVICLLLNLIAIALLWRRTRNMRQNTPFNLTMMHYYTLAALNSGYHVAHKQYVSLIPDNVRVTEEIIHGFIIFSISHTLTNLICVVAMQRYIAVCRPLTAKFILTKKKTKILIACSYSVALLYGASAVAQLVEEKIGVGFNDLVVWWWIFISCEFMILIQVVASNGVYLVIFYKLVRSRRSESDTGSGAGTISVDVVSERSRRLMLRTSIFCFLLAITSLVVTVPSVLTIMIFQHLLQYTDAFQWLDLILAAVYYIILMRDDNNNGLCGCCFCCCCCERSTLTSSDLPHSLSLTVGQSIEHSL